MKTTSGLFNTVQGRSTFADSKYQQQSKLVIGDEPHDKQKREIHFPRKTQFAPLPSKFYNQKEEVGQIPVN